MIERCLCIYLFSDRQQQLSFLLLVILIGAVLGGIVHSIVGVFNWLQRDSKAIFICSQMMQCGLNLRCLYF